MEEDGQDDKCGGRVSYRSGMRGALNMYLLSQKYKLKSFFIYRTQAVGWLIVESLSTVGAFISISIIYGVSGGFAGWTYFQVLALAAITQISGGIVGYTLTPNRLVTDMRNGKFDQLMLKPYDIISSTIARYGDVTTLGTIFSGLLLLVYALLHINLSFGAFLAFLLVYVLGTFVLVFGMLALSVLSYVVLKSSGFLRWSLNIGQDAAQYPMYIYGVLGMTILSTIIPIAFASFFPSLTLFGKIGYAYVGILILVPVIVVPVLYYAIIRMLRRYESGGG